MPEVRLEGDARLEIRHTVWIRELDGDPCAEVVVGQTRNDGDRSESYEPPERVLAVQGAPAGDLALVGAGEVLALSDVVYDSDTGGLYDVGYFGDGVVIDSDLDLLAVAAPRIEDQFDVGRFSLSDRPVSTGAVGATIEGIVDGSGVAKSLGVLRAIDRDLLWHGGWATVGDAPFAGDLYFHPLEWEGERTERDAVTTLSCDAGDYCSNFWTDDDLDGDGVPDIVVGGYWSEPGGRVGVIPLLREGRRRVWDEATTTIVGDTYAGYAGGHVSAGDLDGDGQADLLVGAPRDGAGALFVFRGPLPPGALGPGDADWVVRGDGAVHTLGQSATVGDLDGDGHAELVVAAPANPLLSTDPGTVLVYRGPVAPGEYGPDDADDRVVHRNEGPADAFGWPVLAGDLTGDGRDELVFGASVDADRQGRPVGSVQILYGR